MRSVQESEKIGGRGNCSFPSTEVQEDWSSLSLYFFFWRGWKLNICWRRKSVFFMGMWMHVVIILICFSFFVPTSLKMRVCVRRICYSHSCLIFICVSHINIETIPTARTVWKPQVRISLNFLCSRLPTGSLPLDQAGAVYHGEVHGPLTRCDGWLVVWRRGLRHVHHTFPLPVHVPGSASLCHRSLPPSLAP